MDRRTTAEIVADLRYGQRVGTFPSTLDIEAADRLAELEAEVERLATALHRAARNLERSGGRR